MTTADMQLIERIRQAYPTYNKTRKRIASCILNNPAKCCFLSLKEFSALTETAELTILNFCKSVGADGYIELRHQLQEYVMQWSHPLDRINALQATENGGEEEFYQNIWNRERNAMEATAQRNPYGTIRQAMGLIAKADSIFIAAHNASHIAADYLAIRFHTYGIVMRHLDLENPSKCIPELFDTRYKHPLLIAIATLPYGKDTTAITRLCKEQNVAVISFTDSDRSPLVANSTCSIICPTSEAFGGLVNVYTPFIAMFDTISILFNRYYKSNSSDQNERRLESQYAAMLEEPITTL